MPFFGHRILLSMAFYRAFTGPKILLVPCYFLMGLLQIKLEVSCHGTMQPCSINRSIIRDLYTANAMHRKFEVFPEMKLCSLVPNFYIHISVSDIYTPTIGPQTQYSKVGPYWATSLPKYFFFMLECRTVGYPVFYLQLLEVINVFVLCCGSGSGSGQIRNFFGQVRSGCGIIVPVPDLTFCIHKNLYNFLNVS